MLLKGAYCVGEHFVDPQSAIVFFHLGNRFRRETLDLQAQNTSTGNLITYIYTAQQKFSTDFIIISRFE